MSQGRFNSLIIFIVFASHAARAGEIFEYYNGARALGMGGASIAVVNDETSLLVNPAGLGKLRDKFGTILDPELEAAQDNHSLYNTSPFQSLFDIYAVKPALDASRNTYYYSRGQIFPSFVVKNFGFGIYARQTLAARMNLAGTLLNTNFYDDMGILLGYNFRFWEGRIKLGITGKFLSRIEMVGDFDPTGSLDVATQGAEGAAIGTDVGLTLAAPWKWIPTISAVVRDVGNTAFTSGKGIRLTTTAVPSPIAQDYDVAVALFPIHTPKVRSSFTLEYQKVTEASRAQDPARYYHVGYELNLGDLLFLRAGMNQKYWTAGMELSSEHMQFQLATYGEDVGADGNSEENRRVVMKVGFRF